MTMGAQTFLTVRCYNCGVFQVQQQNKTAKFACKLCGEKQSVRTVYGSSNFGKDMRQLVQKLNTLRGNKEEAELHEVEQENAGWEEDSPLTGLDKQRDTPVTRLNWSEFARGEKAEACRSTTITTDNVKVEPGRAQYTLILPERGRKRSRDSERCPKTRNCPGPVGKGHGRFSNDSPERGQRLDKPQQASQRRCLTSFDPAFDGNLGRNYAENRQPCVSLPAMQTGLAPEGLSKHDVPRVPWEGRVGARGHLGLRLVSTCNAPGSQPPLRPKQDRPVAVPLVERTSQKEGFVQPYCDQLKGAPGPGPGCPIREEAVNSLQDGFVDTEHPHHPQRQQDPRAHGPGSSGAQVSRWSSFASPVGLPTSGDAGESSCRSGNGAGYASNNCMPGKGFEGSFVQRHQVGTGRDQHAAVRRWRGAI